MTRIDPTRRESPIALISTRVARSMIHPTPARVARWIVAEIGRRGGFVEETTMALEIVRLFDGPFAEVKRDGEFTVAPNVRRALRRVAGDRVVWDAAARGWRLVPGDGASQAR